MPTKREIALAVLTALSTLAVLVAFVALAMYLFGVPETLYAILGIGMYAATVYGVVQWVKKRFCSVEAEEEDGEGSEGWDFILRMMGWQFLYALWFKYFVPGSAKELMDQWLRYELGTQLVVSAIVDPSSYSYVPPAAYTSTFPPDFPLHQAHMDLLVYFLLPQLAIIMLAFIPGKAWVWISRKIVVLTRKFRHMRA